jgi:protein-S-isoprenylcysteine O-methyltransferase Ste14
LSQQASSRGRNSIYLGTRYSGLNRWDTSNLYFGAAFMGTNPHVPEENRLRVKFRADFARYCQKTRRWL